MKKSYLIILAVIIIIIVGSVCFKLGFISGKKSLEPIVTQYKKVIDNFFPMPEEMSSIFGKITEIQDNVLSVETTVQNPYILPDEWETKIIKVIITEETEITKFDMETGEGIKIDFSNLKIKDEISARTDENIKDKDEFEAKYVELLSMPEIPEM